MRSPWTGCLVIVFAVCAADARAQFPEGPGGGPLPAADVPAAPAYGVMPGPNLACQPVPAMTPTQECAPLLDIRRFYVDGDYLLWWYKSARMPVLVTGFFPATATAPVGALGNPTTVVDYGNQPISTGGHPGARLLAGFWLDSELTFGMEGGYFFTGERNATYAQTSDGTANSTSFAVPFFNATTRREAATVLARGEGAGSPGQVLVRTGDRLSGAEANLTAVPHTFESNNFRMTFFSGFRYLDLDEQFNLGTLSTQFAGLVRTSQTATADNFATRNAMFGGQLGVDFEFHAGRWVLDFRGRVALLDNHQTVHIDGETSVTTAAGLTTTTGNALFTGPHNIGRFTNDVFVVAPEGMVTLGYQVTRGILVQVGYNYLYMSQVVRPQDVFDRQVNPVSRNPHPTFIFHDSSFWAQGLTTGVVLRF